MEKHSIDNRKTEGSIPSPPIPEPPDPRGRFLFTTENDIVFWRWGWREGYEAAVQEFARLREVAEREGLPDPVLWW